MAQPKIKLRLQYGVDGTFGPGKAELLTLIAKQGSIAAAGRAMKMSYKRAWGLVEEMNSAFVGPLVMTERGGAGRGGATLTELGAELLALYRRLEATVESAGTSDLQRFSSALKDDRSRLPDVPESDMFGRT